MTECYGASVEGETMFGPYFLMRMNKIVLCIINEIWAVPLSHFLSPSSSGGRMDQRIIAAMVAKPEMCNRNGEKGKRRNG